MKAINRYIFKQLLTAVLAITVGLTFAVWLTQSLRLIDFIVNRGLPAGTFLSFIALLLPSFIGIVLPIATFCAVVFVYNKLLTDSELVVLRAAGLSQLQLTRPALWIALIATAAVYSISLYFLPASFRAFKDMQYNLRNDYSTVLLQEGAFNTVTKGITVYVRKRTASDELLGILVHDMRDESKPVTMMAERGALIRSETGPRVVMVNGNRQQRDNDSGRISLLYFDRYTVELARLDNTVLARWREPNERYLNNLLWPGPGPDDQRFARGLIAEGHQRIVMPLYALAFVLVGLGALLSGEFRRRGQTKRVLAAIFVVAVLEALSLALRDVAARYNEVIPLMYAGALVPIVVSLAVLIRTPRRRATAPPQTVPAATP